MSGASPSNGSSPSSPGDSDGATVLVTGAAGFIGSHLCDRLLEEGKRVWGLDSFDDSYDPARKRENLAGALDHPSMHLVEGDVRDQILLDGLMTDVEFDAVVHLAARPGVRASVENPFPTYEVNLGGTLALVEAMRRHDVPALLFASSASVYGGDADSPRREEAPADRPLAPYAASKRAGEMLCHAYHHLHGLTVHCLRFSPVFGPRQRPDLWIHELARRLEEPEYGGAPQPDGGEAESGDYTYVDDAVSGIVLSLERVRRRNGQEPEYQVINVGGSEAVGQGELAEKLSDALGAPADRARQVSGASESQAAPAVSSIEKAAELLGYRPAVSLEEGLAELARWFHRSRTPEEDVPTPAPRST